MHSFGFEEYSEAQVLVVVLDPEFDLELEELDPKTQLEPLVILYPSLQDRQSAPMVTLFPLHVLQPVGHCSQDLFDPLEYVPSAHFVQLVPSLLGVQSTVHQKPEALQLPFVLSSEGQGRHCPSVPAGA